MKFPMWINAGYCEVNWKTGELIHHDKWIVVNLVTPLWFWL